MFRKLGIKTKDNQSGLASIVVVGVLIVLLTVISLGFAKIMQRTAQNSLNDQTAAAATYAAQSGINDLATYIRSNPNVVATNCRDLIGTSSAPGPFFTSANLSGDRNSEYTCILLNQRPDTLFYQQIPAQESKVIKLTTDTTTGSVDKILLSWQATDTSKRTTAPLPSTLPDVVTWNEAGYIPMLRVTIYPITTSGVVTGIQAASRTTFLYPNSSTSGSPGSVDYSAITEGGIQPVACRTDISGGDPTGFGNSARMDCNLALTGLANIPDIDYFYIRVMPIYNNIDLELKAKDIDDRKVRFKGVQAVLDITAKVGPASKRMQARVDIGSNPANGTDPLVPSPNVGPTEDTIPEYALRTANAICKRTLFHDDPYAYITFDGNPASCRAESAIDTPNPSITYFRINGIDDTALTPADPYRGVYYLGAGGTAPLTWQTDHATACMGSRGIGAWPGDKRPPVMTWAGTVGTGSQSIPGITDVTYFDLRCNGPASTTSTRTVTAWPPPRVSISGPGSYTAGDTYTISFSSANASRCEMRSSGNKEWNQDYIGIQASGGSSPSDSRGFSTTWDDRSGKSYIVTCFDPSPGGRPASATWTVGIAGSGSNTTTNPPPCEAYRDIRDNGNGSGFFEWRMACPANSQGSGLYRVESNIPGVGTGDVTPLVAAGYSGTIFTPGNNYCLRVIARDPVWGTVNDTGNKCVDIYPPVTITSYTLNQLWDQGPNKCNNTVPEVWARDKWYCRNDPDTVNAFGPGCANGVHRFTMCGSDLRWQASGGNGSILCAAHTNRFGNFWTDGPNRALGGPPPSFGWDENVVTSGVYLICSDSDGRSDRKP